MKRSTTMVLAFLALSATACTADMATEDDLAGVEATSAESAIVGGRPAAATHEEAALIDIEVAPERWGSCSGALIAPRVVLTAGHCVAGNNRFRVTFPYAKDTRPVESTGAAVFDYPSGGTTVVRDKHDVGLVFLDRAVSIARYPVIATSPVAKGTRAVNIGRKRDGQAEGTKMFVSKAVALEDAAFRGSPHAYTAERLIEKGDSGGPAVLVDSSPPVIVAVASGTGADYALLARVDLVSDWIGDQVRRHGGSALALEGPCLGAPEVEPNGSAGQASALGGTSCGEVGRGDVDWFTFQSDGAETRWSLRLESADAEVRMWKQTGKFWEPVVNATSTSIDDVSTSSGRYVVQVFSKGAPGKYRLNLGRAAP